MRARKIQRFSWNSWHKKEENKIKANYAQIKTRWFSVTYFFFGFSQQIKHTANIQKSLRIDEFEPSGIIIHIEHKNASERPKIASTTIMQYQMHYRILFFFVSRFSFFRDFQNYSSLFFFLFEKMVVCTILFASAAAPAPVYTFFACLRLFWPILFHTTFSPSKKSFRDVRFA